MSHKSNMWPKVGRSFKMNQGELMMTHSVSDTLFEAAHLDYIGTAIWQQAYLF